MWTIGEAAVRAGVTRKAVRVYEANGLLPPPTRSRAGYRLFDDDDVGLLRFIRQARDLDLSLGQIADILHQTTPEAPKPRPGLPLSPHRDRRDGLRWALSNPMLETRYGIAKLASTRARVAASSRPPMIAPVWFTADSRVPTTSATGSAGRAVRPVASNRSACGQVDHTRPERGGGSSVRGDTASSTGTIITHCGIGEL